ncbi:hypothetical protein [Caballeronia sp. M23-90]
MFGWKNKRLGEKPSALTEKQIEFIQKVAHPRLDAVPGADTEILKHFSDVWWNLCLWEKQRADVLDGKAQSLVGLASIASALVGLSTLTTGAEPGEIRAWAACMFLVTVLLAIWALLVSNHGGFLDYEVFDALTAGAKPVGVTPPFTDKNAGGSCLK